MSPSITDFVKSVNIVTIFKKGDITVSENNCRITHLSLTEKVLARIILNPLTLTESIFSESRCHFRANRGNIGMIFSDTKLGKVQKQRK